jgi:hypothetical protein
VARTIATRTIAAPLGFVFKLVADPRLLRQAVPRMGDVELLSERRYRQGPYIMEITEYVPNDHVRVVTQPAGTLKRAVERDMDSIKAFCEEERNQRPA